MSNMSNHIKNLLQYWHSQKNAHQWVLATIINTDGSSYRKAGAMMFINDLGQYYGLLSGGCLESDIMRQSRRCWEDGKNRSIKYDMREEEDLAWQLGIGCGGMVEILLQPIDESNGYLQLDILYQRLKDKKTCRYQQSLTVDKPNNRVLDENDGLSVKQIHMPHKIENNYFIQVIKPVPTLAIFGGGVDARPLVAIAAAVGWQIELFDPRSGYARENYFSGASRIHRQSYTDLTLSPVIQTIDAALVLTHNITLDGQALLLLQNSSSKYVGLLGPIHRTERVLGQMNLSQDQLNFPLANPVGLRLGGELPESIALSMISEVHAFLEKTDGLSISQMLISHA